MKRSFFVKYYSIAFAILPGKAGGLAVELKKKKVKGQPFSRGLALLPIRLKIKKSDFQAFQGSCL
jgi:hypothetical protein